MVTEQKKPWTRPTITRLSDVQALEKLDRAPSSPEVARIRAALDHDFAPFRAYR